MPFQFDMTKFKDLTQEEYWIVLWQFRMLGGFHSSLFETICRADEKNLNKLEMGFPDEVGGYMKYAHQHGWWTNVLNKIRREGKYDDCSNRPDTIDG